MTAPRGVGGGHRLELGRRWDGSRRGPLSLAGDLYLLLIHDRSGRLRVHERIAGYALGGGLLAELVLANLVHVDQRGGLLVSERRPPPDTPARWAWEGLRAEVQRFGVADGVAGLALSATGEVARHLVAVNWLRSVPRRRLPMRTGCSVPVDPNDVFWRPSRLVMALDQEQPGLDDLVLCGLLTATGASGRVLGDSPAFTPGLFTTAWDRLEGSHRLLARVVEQVHVLVDRVATAPH